MDFALELPRLQGESDPAWIIKVVARNGQGRRAVAWGELPARREQLAAGRFPQSARP
jgi:hypothetical protein